MIFFYKNLCQFHTVVYMLVSLQIITFISSVHHVSVQLMLVVILVYLDHLFVVFDVNGKRDLKNLSLFYIYRNCSHKSHQCLIIVESLKN